MITIPIGAWTASVVFDLFALFSEDPSAYIPGAQLLIAIGVIGAVAAAVFGLHDLSLLAPGTAARRTALLHMTLNLAVMVLFIVSFILRMVSGSEELNIAGFVLSILALAVLGVSGWLGGKLAYRYGVRVASEKTQMEGFR